MARKGMETSIVIIVAAIVILITALVVVTIFGGGMQNFLGVLNPWGQTTSGTAICQGRCQQLCLTAPAGTDKPNGYDDNDITINGQTNDCSYFFKCDCKEISIVAGCGTFPNCASACKQENGQCVPK